MPHFIITEAKAAPDGVVTDCRIHPIMCGTECAPQYRADGGVWRSSSDVVAMIANKDAVFALNEHEGHRLSPERVQVEGDELRSAVLSRLAK